MIWQTDSTSSSATELLGERLGSRLKGGETIELVSDLGGGKTTFARGLARGMGSLDHVSSPTFKISNLYKAGKLELHHFDFYRLNNAGVVADELNEVIGQPEITVIVEWGKAVQHILPEKHLTIHITSTDENNRRFEFVYPESLSYLMEDLC